MLTFISAKAKVVKPSFWQLYTKLFINLYMGVRGPRTLENTLPYFWWHVVIKHLAYLHIYEHLV